MSSIIIRNEIEDYVNMVTATAHHLFVEKHHRPLLIDILWVATTGKDWHVSIEQIIDILSRHGINKQKANLCRQLLFLEEGKDFIVREGERKGTKPGKKPEMHFLTIVAAYSTKACNPIAFR